MLKYGSKNERDPMDQKLSLKSLKLPTELAHYLPIEDRILSSIKVSRIVKIRLYRFLTCK